MPSPRSGPDINKEKVKDKTYMMRSNISEVTGITFIDTGVTPPVAGDVVTEPLVGELVGHQCCSVVLD